MKPHIQQTIADIRAAQQRLTDLVEFLESFGGASAHAPADLPAASEAAASPRTPTPTPAARAPRSIQRARPASADAPKTPSGRLTLPAALLHVAGQWSGEWSSHTMINHLREHHKGVPLTSMCGALRGLVAKGVLKVREVEGSKPLYSRGPSFGAPSVSERYAEFRKGLEAPKEAA